MTRASLFGFLAVVFGSLFAAKRDPVNPDPNGKNPIPAVNTVFIEDMTWMEVRDAMKGGKDTVIIATGGIEQNGPYLVTGKHNVVLKGTTEAIARKLGNALVAPIIAFVPEGDIDPPTVHMKYPGSISLTESTFRKLLVDICASFKTHGFKNIVLIGDSGGNQEGMKAVADNLNAKWKGAKSRVIYVPEYYDFVAVGKLVKDMGIKEVPEGYHDDFGMTAMMMAVDPQSVRSQQRKKVGKFSINGVNLAPMKKTIAIGKKIINYRADLAIAGLRKRLK